MNRHGQEGTGPERRLDAGDDRAVNDVSWQWTHGLSPILLTWVRLRDSMAVGQAEELRARLCVL
jgi:hypothetical protein